MIYEEDDNALKSHRREVTTFKDTRFSDGKYTLDIFFVEAGETYDRDFLGVTVASREGVLAERMIDRDSVFHSSDGKRNKIPKTRRELVWFIKEIFARDEAVHRRELEARSNLLIYSHFDYNF